LRYYQLTHDYLVPALRQWLTRKQRETRRGRAAVRLAERAALWNAKPENRHLPAWWEWANIRLFTRQRDWTSPQRQMMKKATRYHALRAGILIVLLALVGCGVYEIHGSIRAQALVQNLATAKTAQVGEIIQQIGHYRRWADPLLQDLAAPSNSDPQKRLRAALALIEVDPGQVDFLVERLLTAQAEDIFILREALRNQSGIVPRLWAVLDQPRQDSGRRLRAAAALAALDPDNAVLWTKVRQDVVAPLVRENLLDLKHWARAFYPVRHRLADLLVERLLVARPADCPPLLLLAREYPQETVPLLEQEVQRRPSPRIPVQDRVKFAERQAQAAAALVYLERPTRARPLLIHSQDPTGRTYLIHKLAALRVPVQILINRLDQPLDVSERRALLLALGEYAPDQLGSGERQAFVQQLLSGYRHDPDPGVHAALRWLLNQWKQGARELARIDTELISPRPRAARRWYVNRLGQTLVVLGPDTFPMGSAAEEGQTFPDETRHRRRIPRRFAIADLEVTVAEFQRFWREVHRQDFPYAKQFSPEDRCPINQVSWYDAAAYCNWLSKKDVIPENQWCYLPTAKGEYAAGMKMAPNFLALEGYRLPTEAEWEYACRAGARTAWACGSSEEMLGQYGWYSANSPGPMQLVGVKKPNDFGLFDLHGNAWEWCQSRIGPYPKATGGSVIEDKEDSNIVKDMNEGRSLRGGSFLGHADNLRSAVRLRNAPADRFVDFGFRPARTLTTE
jgi:formylglycine-generating enzyme required for sulfatase activity